MRDVIFVLGAADPEMRAIERLLASVAVPSVYATVGGKRVYPANAYAAAVPEAARAVLRCGGSAYFVECVERVPAGAVRIDHHRTGDPGYGQPPARYWEASSFGQTVTALAGRLGRPIEITPAMRLTAAADHCLGAAYRGECPGIAPDALLHWHLASRAAFEQRSENDVMRDVEATRQALRSAPRVELAPGVRPAADVRTTPVAELLLAAARDGQCALSAVIARNGRTKIGCLVGSPIQITSFMQVWAPAQRLVDIYGDAARGFAGAYVR